MPDYKSDPLFLHPILHAALPGILSAVKANLPSGWKTGTGSQGIHRTPAEQFVLFQKGRAFKNGSWVVVNKKEKVTDLDGHIKKSRHNNLPATAVDIILIKPNGQELDAGPQEQQIGKGAAKYGLNWGGNWSGWQDLPHIEIPPARLFKKSLDLDEALQWQKYLFHGGALTKPEDLDGLFGQNSKAAMQKLIGTTERTPGAWAQLYGQYGPLEKLTTFDAFSWIPPVS
ncbi:MAG: M15 family metallopeptidase [Chthoniobacter sp.]|uniref:M15 family metallopeptidase n=1 Tax=Chthoniobacter sp. TaxID=2510640 RepID=UPI0032A2D596